MALSKTLGEIRAMPYPEYRSWMAFYQIEPWGWENEEYLMSMIVTMIYNMKVTKKNRKKPSYFMRDISKIFENAPDTEGKSEEEIRNMKRDMALKAFGLI